ncbi:MAG TPA: bacterial transcriptional activator domain-containing protein [Candidatus Baltobacteraceae bacterium]|nr:bacterial transcriptional activator domain-containing protein [Candidatus Baltobacteraceae bacterium]
MEYRIDILKATVSSDAGVLALQSRALEFAMALATHGGRLSARALGELIYADVDDLARLRVTAFRLREQAPGLLVRAHNGTYVLHERTAIDFLEIETALREARSHLPRDGGARLLDHLSRLADPHARHATHRWSWFEGIEARIASYRADICAIFLRNTLPMELALDALASARMVLANDRCDEGAYALGVRALMALDRRAEATRLCRTYEEMIRAEICAEPSPDIRTLLEAAG